MLVVEMFSLRSWRIPWIWRKSDILKGFSYFSNTGTEGWVAVLGHWTNRGVGFCLRLKCDMWETAIHSTFKDIKISGVHDKVSKAFWECFLIFITSLLSPWYLRKNSFNKRQTCKAQSEILGHELIGEVIFQLFIFSEDLLVFSKAFQSFFQ